MENGKQTNSRRARLFPVLLLVCLGIPLAGGVLSLFYNRSKDVEHYHQLMERADPGNSSTRSSPYTAKQQRTKVRKNVLYTKGADRLQMLLTSEDTELVLDHHDEVTEVVENMFGITCYIQEELYYQLPDGRQATKQKEGELLIRHADPKDPASWLVADTPGLKPMQIIRYLEAETGAFYYKKDLFVADQVRLWRYALPGHSLVKPSDTAKPFMKGNAKSIEFSLFNNDINFKAEQLKATFYSPERSL